MWYCVQTAFVDGKHLESKPCFKLNTNTAHKGVLPGICNLSHDEEPHNVYRRFMDGRIEIYDDWFQTKEQAIQFCKGTLTYVLHFDAKYKFIKWETVEVTGDMQPFCGIYKQHKN